MKTIIWKAYWDFDKEEKWLNSMAAKGYALTDYSWCRYVFETAPAGEYTYRIELLQHKPSHIESQHYLNFLEENGVKVVAMYWRWVYLQRPSSEGPFDLYTDAASMIAYYSRLIRFWGLMALLELICGGIQFLPVAISIAEGHPYMFVPQMLAAVLLFGIAAGFIKLLLPLVRRVKQLKRESTLHEY